MSLNLEKRRLAMLDEMHIPFWWPSAKEEETAASEPAVAHLAEARPAPAASSAPTAAPRPQQSPRPSPEPEAARAAPVRPAVSRSAPSAEAASSWLLRPAQALYGSQGLEPGWLLITEAIWPGEDPLAEAAGAAGRLLDNMLRAMRLHQNPKVWLAGLERRQGQPGPLGRSELLQAQQPAMLLLMGRTAVREMLGTDEPLGRLRGRVHEVDGVPAIVTYDAAYLLRAQADKAKAWGDLCLALAQIAQGGRG